MPPWRVAGGFRGEITSSKSRTRKRTTLRRQPIFRFGEINPYRGLWDTDALFDIQSDPVEQNNLIHAPNPRPLPTAENHWPDYIDPTEGK